MVAGLHAMEQMDERVRFNAVDDIEGPFDMGTFTAARIGGAFWGLVLGAGSAWYAGRPSLAAAGLVLGFLGAAWGYVGKSYLEHRKLAQQDQQPAPAAKL